MGNLYVKGAVTDSGIADIMVRNGIIESILTGGCADPAGYFQGCPYETLDACGKRILPAFANMHTHAAMTLVRGLGEDLPLMQWLDEVWKVEGHMDGELIYWGTKLACIEMIKTGTVLFNDQYWFHDQAAKAVSEMGMRALVTYVFLDRFDRETSMKQCRECEEAFSRSQQWNDRLKFGVSVHSTYTVSEESAVWAARFARDNSLKIHLHLSETRQENEMCRQRYSLSPAQFFERAGLMTPDTAAAHSLWLDDRDISVYAANGVTAVHNVNSNLKLASGYRFPYAELRAAGVRVALGTDGCGSSNNLDIRESMKTSALLQRGWRGEAGAWKLDGLYEAASKAGYGFMGVNGGLIAEGAVADFFLVDCSGYAFVPGLDFRSDFVYSANSSCIDTVVCDGNVLMKNRHIEGEEEVYSVCRRLVGHLLGRDNR